MARKSITPAPAVHAPEEWLEQVQTDELARLLEWIRAVDAKVPVLMAISSAIVASVAAVAPVPSNLNWNSIAWIAAGVAPQVVSLVYCALATFPQTKGPSGSLIFFGGIASRSAEQHRLDVARLTRDAHLADLTAQCHRNAQIAAIKYQRVRRATAWLFIGLAPWVVAIYFLYRP
ncbi:MAG: DUF5706 domain-containing protein [Planctomycetota bacterium]